MKVRMPLHATDTMLAEFVSQISGSLPPDVLASLHDTLELVDKRG